MDWVGDMAADRASPHHPQGRMRRIVWFGEMPLQMGRIERALERCDLFVSIGTSGAVYPAAGLCPGGAGRRGADGGDQSGADGRRACSTRASMARRRRPYGLPRHPVETKTAAAARRPPIRHLDVGRSGQDDDGHAAVLGPAFGRVVRGHRLFLTIGDGRHPDQGRPGRTRPTRGLGAAGPVRRCAGACRSSR